MPLIESTADPWPLTARISGSGARVGIELRVTDVDVQERRMMGRVLPPAVRGSALLDTGTQRSLINSRIAQALDLAPTRTTLLRTAAGVTTAVCHAVAFSFVTNGVIVGKSQDLTVARADILEEDMLLGLDVLRRCKIEWNGPTAEVRLLPAS